VQTHTHNDSLIVYRPTDVPVHSFHVLIEQLCWLHPMLWLGNKVGLAKRSSVIGL